MVYRFYAMTIKGVKMKQYRESPYPLRMSKETREYLQSNADANKRSLNAEINLILEKHIEAEMQKQTAA